MIQLHSNTLHLEIPPDSETVYLRLGLEPRECSQSPQSSNRAHRLNEVLVLGVSLQKEFSERQSDR